VACHNRGCLGEYDFEHIAHYARKRFVEGIDTMSLMLEAESDLEREEIALVCLLSVEDDMVKDIQVNCRYSTCTLSNCRGKLRKLIEKELSLVLP